VAINACKIGLSDKKTLIRSPVVQYKFDVLIRAYYNKVTNNPD
jgi:hypothetical protein